MAAAASEVPPPRPAATGIRFSSRRASGGGGAGTAGLATPDGGPCGRDGAGDQVVGRGSGVEPGHVERIRAAHRRPPG